MAVLLRHEAALPVAALVAALRRMVAAARYVEEPGGRDARLDVLGAFCVFAMVVDHIGGAARLYVLTGGTLAQTRWPRDSCPCRDWCWAYRLGQGSGAHAHFR